jgi:hypothetical protein
LIGTISLSRSTQGLSERVKLVEGAGGAQGLAGVRLESAGFGSEIMAVVGYMCTTYPDGLQ